MIKMILIISFLLLLAAFCYIFFATFLFHVHEKGINHFECEKENTKILIIIPANNEELLIRDTIRAIKSAQYPAHLKDIVILADRCTDRTVAIAQEEAVKVYNSTNNIYHTKGGILKSYFEDNMDYVNKYDYICIIDADTLVDRFFFTVANQEFKRGHKIVQGRIEVSNIEKTRVSGFMVVFQSILNTFFFKLQSLRNKSVLLAGKGLLICPSFFDHIMWDEKNLIEDVDISFQINLLKAKIHYCDDLKVICLQPSTLRGLWKQQRRWLSGQNLLIRKYINQIVKRKLDGGAKIFAVEGIVSISILPLILFATISTKILFYLFLFYYFSAAFIAVIAIKNENNRNEIGKRDIYAFPFILVYWYIIEIISFLMPIRRWKK